MMVALVFFSCKEKCHEPPCAKTNINEMANLSLRFCVSDIDTTCFSPAQLGKIVFTQKSINSSLVISVDTIMDLEENNYTIKIGAESDQYQFGDDPMGTEVLELIEYFYEKKFLILNLLTKYINSNFKQMILGVTVLTMTLKLELLMNRECQFIQMKLC